MTRLALCAALLAAAAAAGAAEYEPAPEGLDAREVARRAEDQLRSDTTFMEATMTIESPRLPAPRVVRFQSWDDRPGKRSFIRILAPPKDDGTGFLKLHPNLWMYVPRVERTVRIPPSMMLQPWMGSDFSNDDLVRESSTLDDYDHRLLGVDSVGDEARPAYVVEYVPHEDAAVVWGRIVAWIDRERYTPLRQEYYDEDGVLVREMELGDVREVDGRWFAHDWEMRPVEKEGHRTAIRVESVRFDVDIDESRFTKRQLQRGVR